MSKEAFSRREFLKVAAAVGVVGTTASFLSDAWGDGKGQPSAGQGHVSGGDKGHQRGKAELQRVLQATLDFNVSGVENNNRIGSRLAANLVEIGGRSQEILEARRDLLFRAALEVRRNQGRTFNRKKRTVTQNLNDLLFAIRNESANSGFANSLINAVIVSVLFSTHGAHFDDTWVAHQQSRQALLALKDRKSSDPIGSRIDAKRSALENYRAVTAATRGEVFSSGKFPEDVIIRSVWLMRRSRGARRV